MGNESYHFVGIGGIGMSGLARILLQKNFKVSGSDLASSPVMEKLGKAGAEIYFGHSADHVDTHKTVVYTSDVKEDNPEVAAAHKLKCRLLHRSQLLAKLMEGYKALAISGTHGKTTTSALLTWVLIKAGLDPSYAIGGLVAALQANASHGSGEYFVAEADESDGSFLNYAPTGAIITNIDLDHLSHFGSEKALIKAFADFAASVTASKLLFWCGDDTRLQTLRLSGTSYGFSEACALRASHFRAKGWHSLFDVTFEGKTYRDVEVALIGRHNALNALAVFGLALRLGVSEKVVREALLSFTGVGRRCEVKGETRGALVLDDYAHHPTEIRATLSAIREAIGPRRLIAVFQPHRYSRTQECAGHYAGMFDSADEVFITDIYGSREKPLPGVTHELVQREVEVASNRPLRYVPRDRLKDAVVAFVRPHDVVVTMGAGDITKISGEIADDLKRHPPKKLVVGVLCGGVSTEHDVTLMSVRQVTPRLSDDFYAVKPIGITKQGCWISGPDVVAQLEQASKEGKRLRRDSSEPPLSPEVLKELLACDVLIPMLHGTYGEDGIVQGFLEVLGKPYVGCDPRAAAISMDKAVCKKLCQVHDIATAPFVDFSRYEWEHERDQLLEQIEQQFSWPVWAKPTHLGSSVEVHRTESREALSEAIDRIFRVDTHAMVEPEVRGRELEVAVFGDGELTSFPPGEVFTGQRVYDYVGKYTSGGTPTAAIAEISPEQAEEGMELAKRIFSLAGCSGLARIDFFLDEEGRYQFNEINPLPGFTRNSLYPRMCEANGWEVGPLMDRLIQLALQRRRQQNRLEV